MRPQSCVVLLALAACSAPLQPGPAMHQPRRIVGAQKNEALDRDKPLVVVIALELADADGLGRLIAAQQDRGSSQYRRYLTPVEFGRRFGVADADWQRLHDWAGSHALTIVREADGRNAMTLYGRAADLERAFGTHLDWYQDARGRFYAPSAELRPDGVADLIHAVAGLDDAARFYSQMSPAPAPAPSPQGKSGFADPADLQHLYQVDTVTERGEGETIGILGTGYGPSTADIDGFLTSNRISRSGPQPDRAAQYTQVTLDGFNTDTDPLAQNEYGENVLDIDMVFGMATHADVVHVITESNTPGLFNDGIVFFINQVPQAHAVSVSYGSCERNAAAEATLFDVLFQQAMAEGQMWFFASGDYGSDACEDNAAPVPSALWPAVSPFVIGVGGTTEPSGVGGAETAWNGSGGGESELYAKPAYQTGVGPFPNDGVRDFPDVAALAFYPYVTVYYASGGVSASAGTSAATPQWASVWAMLNQHVCSATGNCGGITDAHDRLYALGKAQTAGGTAVFHDITSGNNKNGPTQGFTAVAGYDLVTGWGSPDLAALMANW
jgi:kumamolisin